MIILCYWLHTIVIYTQLVCASASSHLFLRGKAENIDYHLLRHSEEYEGRSKRERVKEVSFTGFRHIFKHNPKF